MRFKAAAHLFEELDIALKHASYLIELSLQVLIVWIMFELLFYLYYVSDVCQPRLSKFTRISEKKTITIDCLKLVLTHHLQFSGRIGWLTKKDDFSV